MEREPIRIEVDVDLGEASPKSAVTRKIETAIKAIAESTFRSLFFLAEVPAIRLIVSAAAPEGPPQNKAIGPPNVPDLGILMPAPAVRVDASRMGRVVPVYYSPPTPVLIEVPVTRGWISGEPELLHPGMPVLIGMPSGPGIPHRDGQSPAHRTYYNAR